MDFNEYIESKIRKELDSVRRQGPRRDIKYLVYILNYLFWKRTSLKRSVDDILPSLGPYRETKKDTLQDNLEYLSKVPKKHPFITFSPDGRDVDVSLELNEESPTNRLKTPNKEGRPKNIYTLNKYYIMDYFTKSKGVESNSGISLVDCQENKNRIDIISEQISTDEPGAFDKLVQVLLTDESKFARQEATRMLKNLNEIKSKDPLIKAMLSDKYGAVRIEAAEGLEKFGYCEEVIRALGDVDVNVRLAVVRILGRLKNVRSLEPLKEALRDPDVGVQCKAANALGEIGDESAIEPIINLLDSKNESVRIAAVSAIGQLGNNKNAISIQALERACNDPNKQVRDEARMYLKKIGERLLEKD